MQCFKISPAVKACGTGRSSAVPSCLSHPSSYPSLLVLVPLFGGTILSLSHLSSYLSQPSRANLRQHHPISLTHHPISLLIPVVLLFGGTILSLSLSIILSFSPHPNRAAVRQHHPISLSPSSYQSLLIRVVLLCGGTILSLSLIIRTTGRGGRREEARVGARGT